MSSHPLRPQFPQVDAFPVAMIPDAMDMNARQSRGRIALARFLACFRTSVMSLRAFYRKYMLIELGDYMHFLRVYINVFKHKLLPDNLEHSKLNLEQTRRI